LDQYAKRHLEARDKIPVLRADTVVTMKEIHKQTLDQIYLMAPFGQGNPPPNLVMRGVKLLERRQVGADGAHLKIRLSQKGRQMDAIGFQMGADSENLHSGALLDVMFTPEFNHWNGRTEIQLNLRDIKPWDRPDNPLADTGTAGDTAAEIPAANSGGSQTSPSLRARVQKAVLGNLDYHPMQQEALTALEKGQNTLVVMGTGRGKSAIFQTMAAELAMQGQMALLIYPLRSLVNDQYHRFETQLGPLGVTVNAVCGLMSTQERKHFFKLYGQRKAGIILTTPEFLRFHQDTFALAASRIGLFVVDEAHHLFQAKRTGYQALPDVWRKLGRPLVLAATATAGDETARQISQSLDISRWVLEDFRRDNLHLVDSRKERDKLAYLIKVIGEGKKTVIYMNSREQVMALTQTLKDYLPFMDREIGYYHGGLDSDTRKMTESMFQTGLLRVMISTSAFGEGIDIPDIHHVILYHMCFSKTEFNQLSGRAGRNHEKAWIHLLFNEDDSALNRIILDYGAPSRELLGKFYLMLKQLSKGGSSVENTDEALVKRMKQLGYPQIHEGSVAACLAVLEELGLLLQEREGNRRYIHMAPPPPAKLDLSDSVRYREGQEERDSFEAFLEYISNSSPEALLNGFNRPILPERRMPESG
jgi:single-stranded-DNA-specific exonuclease